MFIVDLTVFMIQSGKHKLCNLIIIIC